MVVLVTGGSSGIGAAACRAFAAKGAVVYAASRRGVVPEGCPANVKAVAADVTVPESISAAVASIVSAEGRIDVVICNAGNGIAGAIEETSLDEARYQFDTCFFGAHNTVRAVLPYFRAQHSGRIITTGSVASVVPIPYQAFYSSVKAAVLMYTEALAMELRPFGIQCCCVLPGDTKTGFTSARKYVSGAVDDSPYAPARKASVSKMEKDEVNGMAPEVIARAMTRAAFRRRMPMKVTPRLDYQAVNLLVKLLPARLMTIIVGKVY